jgi:hypothetical protein
MTQQFAFINQGNVVNIAVFDSPSTELLEFFKRDLELEHIIPTNEDPKAMTGGTWDGIKFIPKRPFDSWTYNEVENDWEAPVPYPKVDDSDLIQYYWDEPSLSWVLLD